MRKLYGPRFFLLVISALVVIYCLLASTPNTSADCISTAGCTEDVPAKATELLSESLFHQFVSAVAPY